ncbi:MAG: hypothetical protein DWQ37_04055 [Planctomycetota bacterium]|nr:MAG: hypothetical protein DWQ37_04055 [Planctomycetota bacterium]
MCHANYRLPSVVAGAILIASVACGSAQAQFSGNTRTRREPPKLNFGNSQFNTQAKRFQNFSPPRQQTPSGGKYLGKVNIPQPKPFQYTPPQNNFGNSGNNFWRPSRPQYNDYEYERPQRYQEPQRYYSNDNRNYSYSQPQSTPVTTPAPAEVEKNAKPPEKIVEPKSNAAPAFALLDPIDADSYALVGEMVQEEAQISVDRLEEQLGEAAKEGPVAEKIMELREKIAAGEAITDQDMADLGNLVNAVDPAKFPPGFDVNRVDQAIKDIIRTSETNELYQQNAYPDDGLAAGLPSGPVLMMPALPEDEMLLMPGGGVIMGTGGEGQLEIAAEDASEILDISIGVGDPEPDSDANVAKRAKSGTYIMNPKDSPAEVSYVVSNHNYTIKPGYTQLLDSGETWVIRFDKGEGQGEAKYTLSDGTYVFGTSDDTWNLFKTSFSVTVDNGDNESPFFVNIDNTQEEVAAGAKRTFESEYPILVRFDRGSGGDPAQKRITRKNADLVVAVNRTDGLWDLYPAENYQGVARKSGSKKNKIHQALLREKLRLSRQRGN